jgi:hypothetical protein
MLLDNSRVLPQHRLQMLSGASAPPGSHCGGIAGRTAGGSSDADEDDDRWKKKL